MVTSCRQTSGQVASRAQSPWLEERGWKQEALDRLSLCLSTALRPQKPQAYNITLLPSVSTLIARGMFCGAKYTRHTFTPIIKHLITTTANKHPGKKSFIDKNMKNTTGIMLCISHKIATSRRPPLKSYCPNKSNYKNYRQRILIN